MSHPYLIWKYFLKKEEKDFKEEMGYGKKEITKIGKDKFLKAWDWTERRHVSKWRTDILRVIICPNCGKEFGVFDRSLGLCDSCIVKFDMTKFYSDLEEALATKSEEAKDKARFEATAIFLTSKDLRNKYKVIEA